MKIKGSVHTIVNISGDVHGLTIGLATNLVTTGKRRKLEWRVAHLAGELGMRDSDVLYLAHHHFGVAALADLSDSQLEELCGRISRLNRQTARSPDEQAR